MMKKEYSLLISEIKAFFKKNNYQKAVLGLSGGLDSAVCAKLLADALGNDNVTALIMPDKITSKENIRDAAKFAEFLKIKYKIVRIDSILEQFNNLSWKQNKTAVMNTKARTRALILYNYANSNNALVAGTSNKSEILLGYGTKYGDLAADVYIIGGFFKTEIKQLAYFLKIPEKIINKVPSAELYHGQTDEKELSASYTDIDCILKKISKKQDIEKNRLADRITNRIKYNEHKTKQPALIKVNTSS